MADGSHDRLGSDVLSHDELALLAGHPEDVGIISRIKSMGEEQLRAIDQCFGPKRDCITRYNLLQIEWMKTAGYLLGTRLRRCPTEEEFLAEYLATNSRRFRAFCVLKHPEWVQIYPDAGGQYSGVPVDILECFERTSGASAAG